MKKLKSQVHTVYYALNNLFIVDEELYEIMTTEISEKYIDSQLTMVYLLNILDVMNVMLKRIVVIHHELIRILEKQPLLFIENYKLIMDNKFNNWKYLYKLIDDIVILSYFNWFTVKDDNLRKL